MVKQVEIEVDTILFDMDGTLIDSTPAVNATWASFAHQYNLDLSFVMQTCHGYRTVENLKRFIPSIPDEQIAAEVERFESNILVVAKQNAQRGIGGSIVAMPGAKELLSQINIGRPQVANAKGNHGWAIVTSATKAYAQQGFVSAGVSEQPKVFITSDLCTKGKPDPQPYLLGAEKTNQDITRCLVVEDAPPGVRAGKLAGAKTLALRTTHSGEKMQQEGADYIVEDLRSVKAQWKQDGSGLILTIQVEEPEKGEAKGISSLAIQLQKDNQMHVTKVNGIA
ncbi:related to HOR2 - DL-glycerol phosphatase [Melanopsichium pennsylvanicum]|uniref:Related to HOR2 - DL-glycerol phosphatase n=2 Tax=Melanopsichium pennsylvanicum TaxID=63383 RepID=A0AAJ4XKH9_9BASI|nr:related to HOR2-DL-glycerol phosphatase [Melanopsichium pennsylvanicum 4]SNX83778.1 related to HOR2 - DL-glycerol phosphatase [Melanopsichium pennsylvanicum]